MAALGAISWSGQGPWVLDMHLPGTPGLASFLGGTLALAVKSSVLGKPSAPGKPGQLAPPPSSSFTYLPGPWVHVHIWPLPHGLLQAHMPPQNDIQGCPTSEFCFSSLPPSIPNFSSFSWHLSKLRMPSFTQFFF